MQPQVNVVTIVDGLKRLYAEKLKPLEVTYRFNDFESPVLVSELISVVGGLCFISFFQLRVTALIYYVTLVLLIYAD